ncbi:hypothetical protein HOLleu_43676 [Holothuria leucospilota]|uniref:Uncharacterized protein n=1 Tax=Holothuria leucospilota TaxID=206669 RepID=A0A9Q1BAX5_HOLLE|nr:hypothetical protein HOLleu_43676 [Holothuria leucospilota]
MSFAISNRQKRRKVNATVDKYIEDIRRESEINDDISIAAAHQSAARQVIYISQQDQASSEAQPNLEHIEQVVTEPSQEECVLYHSLSSDADTADFNFLVDEEENICPIGSPSDKSTSESELGFDLQDEIAKWSTDHNITHRALSDLLKILGEDHPELPKHPRTLLGTNTNYTLKLFLAENIIILAFSEGFFQSYLML